MFHVPLLLKRIFQTRSGPQKSARLRMHLSNQLPHGVLSLRAYLGLQLFQGLILHRYLQWLPQMFQVLLLFRYLQRLQLFQILLLKLLQVLLQVLLQLFQVLLLQVLLLQRRGGPNKSARRRMHLRLHVLQEHQAPRLRMHLGLLILYCLYCPTQSG